MKEENEILLKEYELCQESTQRLDSLIWKTSGIIGVGSIGSLAAIAASLVAETSADVFRLPVGLGAGIGSVVIAVVWIWWGMARRWWGVQHCAYLRMEHIESTLGMYQVTYSRYKNGARNADGVLQVARSNLQEDEKPSLRPDMVFKSRGVQKWLRWLPPLLSGGWVVFLAWAVGEAAGIGVKGMVDAHFVWFVVTGMVALLVGGGAVALWKQRRDDHVRRDTIEEKISSTLDRLDKRMEALETNGGSHGAGVTSQTDDQET